jgi:hypothetical protein
VVLPKVPVIPRPILHELAEPETSQPEIKSYCRRCTRSRYYEDDYGVISPKGIAHIDEDYGMTACGIDATGEKWWWRL